MDQQPEANVPVQVPHVHKMWNVLSILFLVLFILSVVFNVFLFLSWSGQTDIVADLEEDIEELAVEEEGVKVILDRESEEGGTGVFEEGFISFEYPDNVYITATAAPGGLIFNRELSFWTKNDDGILISTGLRLNYFHTLKDTDGGTTFEDVKVHWQNLDPVFDVYQEDSYSLSDREVVHIITGDLSGDTMAIYIPVLAPDELLTDVTDSEDVYRFSGAFLNEEISNEILDLFFETVILD